MTQVAIKRALLSVSDKTGLAELGAALARHGVELVSTGGTAKALRESGLKVMDISDLTGFPEMMDGRVKTLHPKVHGGLLAVRNNAEHVAAMDAHEIGAIDLVVVNLYPFAATVAKGADRDEIIENIDIGGPSMVRSAAKNHESVVILTDPADYAELINAMDAHSGATDFDFRRRCAAKAYAATAAYDSMISQWFALTDLGQTLPGTLAIAGVSQGELRYGENPHQSAALYIPAAETVRGIPQAQQLQGKELSYNNYNDTDAALELVSEFRDGPPTVVIVKHANPCGVATGETLLEAYQAALACDSVSAFGGIIAVNRPLDAATAEAMAGIFTEVVAAPDASEEAKAIFAKKKNLRLLLTGALPDPHRAGLTVKSIAGGYLVQSRDNGRITREELKVVTQARADRTGTNRLPVRLDHRQAHQVQRDCLCQGWRHRRHRRGPDEPPRQRAHRRDQGQGSRRNLWMGAAPHHRFRRGVRCVLPVLGWFALRRGSRRDRRHPAGRINPRR